jgi:hypothetical protein
MRRTITFVCLLGLLVGACGQEPSGSSSSSSAPGTTTTSEPSTSTTGSPPVTLPTTTSTNTPEEHRWTVEAHGQNPTIAFGGRGELGSGCSPGTDQLPDGIWFGWIDEAELHQFDFDLACLWPGRLEPAASNEAAKLRSLPVADGAVVYLTGGETARYTDWDGVLDVADNAPGLRQNLGSWVFVNEGVVTEISEYPEAISWARSATAWPGLVPGCCDGGDVAPASPDGPLPETGWPADGFYKAWPITDGEYGPDWSDAGIGVGYRIAISSWLSCDENPELCPEWWVGDEVTVDRETPGIERTLPFDDELTVVIMPIFGDYSIVGGGNAFEELLDDLNRATETSLEPDVDLDTLSEDPAFPFGRIPWPGETENTEFGYRGPGGAHLAWFGGWLALEIRDGVPILYIHAGLIAG